MIRCSVPEQSALCEGFAGKFSGLNRLACYVKRKVHMNSMTKSRIYLPIAALILAALVVPAAAQNLVPFKGAIQGQETHSGAFPIITANGSCTGIATVVGKLSLTYQDTIDLRTASGTGIGQLIAANGDNIYLTNRGSADLVSTPGFAIITEIYTITGGTGRFAGAQGSFSLDRSVNQATGFTSGSWHGTITSPGAAH